MNLKERTKESSQQYATEPELIAVSLFLVEICQMQLVFITIVFVFWIVTFEGCAMHP